MGLFYGGVLNKSCHPVVHSAALVFELLERFLSHENYRHCTELFLRILEMNYLVKDKHNYILRKVIKAALILCFG